MINKFYKIVILSGILSASQIGQAQILEISTLWNDRFEKDCSIREGYDSYQYEKGINSVFKPYIVKKSDVEHQAYSSSKYILKNVQYRGIPVNIIEFSYGNMSKQYHQIMYLDLSSSQAKTSFNKITWTKIKKDDGYTELATEKKGKIVEVRCTWLDPQHRF